MAENYVHRIGRTARAGADGMAIALCAPDEMGYLRDIEKAMKATVPVASGRPWDPVAPEQPKRRSGPRRSGGKPGGASHSGRPAGAKPAAAPGGRPGGFKRRSSGNKNRANA